MGILDSLDNFLGTGQQDDPRTQANLALAAQLLGSGGGMQRLTAGLQNRGAMMDLARRQEEERARRAQEAQMRQLQLEQILRAQKAQEAAAARESGIDAVYRGALEMPAQQALMQGGGPTVGNAQAMQGMQPRLNQDALLRGLAQIDPRAAAQMLTPKPEETKIVGDALVGNGPGGWKELYRAPQKPEKINPNQPFMVVDGQIVPNKAYQEYELEKAKRGAANVSAVANAGDNKLPATIIKTQDDLIDKLTTARATDADLGALQQQIATGKLNFGPVQNLANQARNAAGFSNEQSRNFATFKSSLEKLRNDSLRLNNGVQTEGDAQRAWNELFQSVNDPKLVEQRLVEIRKINQRAAQLQAYKLQVMRDNFDAGSIPELPISPALSGGKSATPSVSNW